MNRLFHRLRFLFFFLFAAMPVVELFGQVSATCKLIPDSQVYYVGQQVRLELSVEFTDCEPEGGMNIRGMPDAAELTAGEFSQLPSSVRTDGGRKTTVNRFATLLRFHREGSFTFAPELTGASSVRQRRGGFSMFMNITSFRAPVAGRLITVKPLPEPKPEGFCGAIGKFRIESTAEPQKVSPGDLVTLRWTIRGAGNLDALSFPDSLSVPGFKVYPPKEESRDPGRSVTFTRVFIPETEGNKEIPSVGVGVFNPESGRYEELRSEPVMLTAVPRAENTVPATNVPTFVPTVDAPSSAAVRNAAAPHPLEDVLRHPFALPLASVALAAFVFAALAGMSKRVAAMVALAVLVLSFFVGRGVRDRFMRGGIAIKTAASARLCPSSSSRLLLEIPQGERVRIVERSGKWCRVEFNGASGWIHDPEMEVENEN